MPTHKNVRRVRGLLKDYKNLTVARYDSTDDVEVLGFNTADNVFTTITEVRKLLATALGLPLTKIKIGRQTLLISFEPVRTAVWPTFPGVPTVRLKPGERIVAVVPEYCAGPGWANRPIWVHIVNQANHYRMECIQPEQQSKEQQLLFRLAETAHRQMIDTVKIIHVK